MVNWNETKLDIADVCRRLATASGRKPHKSTVIRWIRDGVHGVRLEAARVGHRFIVTAEAVDRFILRLNETTAATPPPMPPTRRSRSRERDLERARQVCAKAGI